MPLNIKNEEAYLLAKELANIMNESITNAVTIALREALTRKSALRKIHTDSLLEELSSITDFTSSLPLKDSRSADEILGYDERGLPGLW